VVAFSGIDFSVDRENLKEAIRMKLPEFTFGTYKDVKKQSVKFMRRLKKGEPWDKVFHDIPMLDTNDTSAWIVVNGPSPIVNEGGMKNFHIYVIHDVISYQWTSTLKEDERLEIEQSIFNSSLLESWSLLSLISMKNSSIWVPFYSNILKEELSRTKWKAVLESCIKYWNEFDGEGSRYSVGLQEGYDLWSLPLGIKKNLFKFNVPSTILDNPLPRDKGFSIVNEWIDL
jgi:hypothetical protein